MSTGNRVTLIEARQITRDFMQYIGNVSYEASEAGSVRRLSPTVGDIDIVVRPHSLASLWNRIDRMLENGTIRQAIYGDGKKRWGDTSRGIYFMGMRLELTTADSDNWGYKLWLQTGKGDKNNFFMSQLIKFNSTVRFQDGYGWHVSYDKAHPRFNTGLGYAKLAKLSIPDEQTLYTLVGMPFIAPQNRVENTYRRYISKAVNNPPAEAIQLRYANEQPEHQTKMF
jgi:DNA polymerase/3'-5' exonuclease PolX